MIKHDQEKRPFLKNLTPCLHFSENFKNLKNLGGVKLKHLLEIQNMKPKSAKIRERAAATTTPAIRSSPVYKPFTLNSNPWIADPKPFTLNPEPFTLNPVS